MEDKEAYRDWRFRFYSFKEADERCQTLKAAREAQFLTMECVGAKLGLSPQGYRYLEQSDLAGTISVNNLRRCAKALNCELLYELKPAKRFSLQIWEILVKAVRRPKTQSALAFRAMDKMFDPWFRKEQGWCKNSEEQARSPASWHSRTRVNLNDPTIMQRVEKLDF